MSVELEEGAWKCLLLRLTAWRRLPRCAGCKRGEPRATRVQGVGWPAGGPLDCLVCSPHPLAQIICSTSPFQRDKLAAALLKQGYIPGLIDIFKVGHGGYAIQRCSCVAAQPGSGRSQTAAPMPPLRALWPTLSKRLPRRRAYGNRSCLPFSAHVPSQAFSPTAMSASVSIYCFPYLCIRICQKLLMFTLPVHTAPHYQNQTHVLLWPL